MGVVVGRARGEHSLSEVGVCVKLYLEKFWEKKGEERWGKLRNTWKKRC